MDTRPFTDRFAEVPYVNPETMAFQDWYIDLLMVFEDYRILPTNAIKLLFPGHGMYIVNLLRRLRACRLVTCRTFNGTENRNQVLAWSRTEAGDRFLEKRGKLLLPQDNIQDRERALVDTIAVSMKLGARKHGLDLLFRRDIALLPDKPDIIKTDPRPRFYLDDKHYFRPDGFHMVAKGGHGFAVYEEVECSPKDYKRYVSKLKNWKEAWDRKLYKTQHGFNSAIVRFTAANDVSLKSIMEAAKEVTKGSCSWMIFRRVEDWTHRNGTPPITDSFMTEPYQRVGLPEYSFLNEFSK